MTGGRATTHGEAAPGSGPASDPLVAMPAAELFGFEFRERDESGSCVALPIRAGFLQGQGRVHGGIVATLADTAAVWALLRGIEPDRTLTSIEFKLNFVRPAVEGRGELLARGRVVRRGRTVGLVDVDVEQRGELVAKGLFTYLFTPRPPSAPEAAPAS